METTNVIIEAVIFLTYILICGGLIRVKYSKSSVLAAAGILLVVAGIQTIIIASGKDMSFVLTMLPLTAYLPVSLGMYLLLEKKLFRMAAVWTIGCWSAFTLRIFKKILMNRYMFIIMHTDSAVRQWVDTLLVLAVILAALIMVFAEYKFLRKPLIDYMNKSENRLHWFYLPMLMVFMLLLYFDNLPTNNMNLVLVLAVYLSIPAIAVKVFTSSAEMAKVRQEQQELFQQMEMQKKEYEYISEKNDQNRIYRHDMRHHLAVLKEFAKEGNTDSILEYIQTLNGKLSDSEFVRYCENTTVNAVLSAKLGAAQKIGCVINTSVIIPKELPFDEMDICMVLSNVLENAVNACAKIKDQSKRYINITAEMLDNSKIIISAVNPSEEIISFDREGFPVRGDKNVSAKDMQEHGIGLRSVKAVADKYNGYFQCECNEGEFKFKSVFFSIGKNLNVSTIRRYGVLKRALASAFISITAFVLFVNFMPVMAHALESVPGMEIPVKIARAEYFNVRWGDTGITENRPEFDGDDKSAAADMNLKAEDYINSMKDKFTWYLSHKYSGYVNEDISYKVIRDDDRLLSVFFTTVINAGSSAEYNRYINLDKQSGKVLELKDLFVENSSYITVISEEIKRQMKVQNDSGKARYFIPGSIWSDDECFKEISEEQNFYINESNQLVIAFDKYEVAPGSMGAPEFVIDTGILQNILTQPSCIGGEKID